MSLYLDLTGKVSFHTCIKCECEMVISLGEGDGGQFAMLLVDQPYPHSGLWQPMLVCAAFPVPFALQAFTDTPMVLHNRTQ